MLGSLQGQGYYEDIVSPRGHANNAHTCWVKFVTQLY